MLQVVTLGVEAVVRMFCLWTARRSTWYATHRHIVASFDGFVFSSVCVLFKNLSPPPPPLPPPPSPLPPLPSQLVRSDAVTGELVEMPYASDFVVCDICVISVHKHVSVFLFFGFCVIVVCFLNEISDFFVFPRIFSYRLSKYRTELESTIFSKAIAARCRSVVVSRCAPLQKALVVRLMKAHFPAAR